jgi:hypothetical protein
MLKDKKNQTYKTIKKNSNYKPQKGMSLSRLTCQT